MVTTKSRISADDLYRLEIISSPRISPDGAFVVYSQARVERKTEKKYANLWLVPTAGGRPKQFTRGNQADTTPRWSPDGATIAFLSNRADKDRPPHVFLIPASGGEARQLSNIPGEISSLAWTPDGKNLLLSVRKFDPEERERFDDEQKKKLGTVCRRYDRLFYKLDGYGYLAHERLHLWLVDVDSGRARQLTDHKVYDEKKPDVSPDNKWVVFVSNHSESPDAAYQHEDLFIIPLQGGRQRLLPTPAGDKQKPSFSPDGKWIAYIAHEGEQDYGWRNDNIWVVPVDGSVKARNLTENHDFHVSSWTINDQGESPEQMPPLWSNDGKRIYFQVARHGCTQLMSISVDGKDLQLVVSEQGVVAAFSMDKAQSKLAYNFGSVYDPNQVLLRDMASGKVSQLTSLNKALFSKVDLGEVHEMWFKGGSGNDLQGWILTPPGFDPKKKYPCILEIHGGPQTQYGFYYMHEFFTLAAKGYVVAFCNPRGGRGYGEKHTRAIWGDWGTHDYNDLMKFADLLEKEAYIDRQRMGVTGGSYGGYMTVWIVGHTQRFKAAVSQRCVSNFISMWGSSDYNWTFEAELKGKPPYEDLNYYWDHSPMKYIRNCKTPMLVIHNENDMRCPIEQSEQVYVALKRLGVDTAFVRFPDEFHGLSRGGRTDRRIARLDAILGWFETHLKK
jgi:dipeptidyl aminopeptidase/acylaminoacyl peptidase